VLDVTTINMMILRKDEIIAFVTGVDEIRIIENLDGIFDITRRAMFVLRNKEFLCATILAMVKK